MSPSNEAYAPGYLREHDDGSWGFILPLGSESSKIDALSPLFQEEWGYGANGHAWQAVIETFMRTHHADSAATLHYNSEADMFCVYCAEAAPLKIIAQFLRELLEHPEKLRAALQRTEPD